MGNEEKNTSVTLAERFTNAIVSAYGDVAKGVGMTVEQKQLISNYYIKLDEMFRDPKVNIKWNQVRLPELATTLAHMAKLGLDMSIGQLSFIPFKKGDTGTYNFAPVISKYGYEYIAKKYGLEPPGNVTVELVYETDKFSITKKDYMHTCDTYSFEVTNPFNRGKIVGGFGYLEYKDKTKNKILAMSEQEILSYRPPRYSNQFWTGENMKKMYEKTIAKQLLKKVTLDPDKVNGVKDSFERIESEELNYNAAIAQEEVNENMCSGEFIDIDYRPVDENNEEHEEEVKVENIELDKEAELMNARKAKREEFGIDDAEQEHLPWD